MTPHDWRWEWHPGCLGETHVTITWFYHFLIVLTPNELLGLVYRCCKTSDWHLSVWGLLISQNILSYSHSSPQAGRLFIDELWNLSGKHERIKSAQMKDDSGCFIYFCLVWILGSMRTFLHRFGPQAKKTTGHRPLFGVFSLLVTHSSS